jgi:O-antigen/teichoic acid export membrane protein
VSPLSESERLSTPPRFFERIPLFYANAGANFIGRIWSAFLLVALVPIYIRFMGIEAYGLVGFFATLQALFAVLDLGLGAALNRELPRLSANGAGQKMHDLIRTLEVLYWGVAVVIGVGIIAVSGQISTRWVHVQHLSTTAVRESVLIMGISLVLQFPLALYSGGLAGIERQVTLGKLVVTMATVRAIIVILALWLIAPIPQVFFAVHAIVNALQTTIAAILLRRRLPATTEPPRFRREVLLDIGQFTTEVAGITILGVLLSQVDKITLSTMLPLASFGYYTMATSFATAIYALVNPVFAAAYPRLSALVSAGDEKELVSLYHRSAQLLSVAIIPVTVVTALFAREILSVWTHNSRAVESAHLLVTCLMIGTMFHGLMHIPYALQLANGWTRLTLVMNLCAAALLVPGIWWAAHHYGALGAAVAWIALNLVYLTIFVTLMHRRLLRNEKRNWAVRDVGYTALGALVVAVPVRLLFPHPSTMVAESILLVLVSALTLLTAASVTPFISSFVRTRLRLARAGGPDV